MNKLVASLAQATSEVSMAAVNLNLDFSIFKFEAPPSYKAFGEKLSLQRKEKAEYGSPHTTARKLGALFNETLPKTPTLITAYGVRVSEILPMIQSDTEDIAIKNIFRHQLGADGTTIWAAATSGDGAVPVHLLACLLARAWSGPEATSIWAQIVAERKKEIAEGYENGTLNHYPTLSAFRQEITREQLAEWDASARAWVRAADEVKKKDHDSLRLIISHLDLPVDSGGDLYKNVTRVWHSSMVTMENLLNGISQTVYNGATLLGISSWHILPDIISFKPSITEIKHNDPLFRPGGVLTVGLQFVSREPSSGNDSTIVDDGNAQSGVFWSLSLSHLKFYGPPVQVSRSLGVDSTRVDFDQFMLLALGSISAYLKGRLVDYARFFSAIWKLLEETTIEPRRGEHPNPGKPPSSAKLDGPKDSGQDQTSLLDRTVASSFIRQRQSNWVKLFYMVSVTLLEAEGLDLDVACMLANCGRRRGKNFWSSATDTLPFLGLCQPRLFIPLLRDTHAQIEVLRSMAQKSTYASREDLLLLIRYPTPNRWAAPTEVCFWEAATATPIKSRTSKRAADGSEILAPTHRRFVIVEPTTSGYMDKNPTTPCTCPAGCLDPPENPAVDPAAADRACPCKLRKLKCTRACHFGSVRQCNRKPTSLDVFLETRLKEIVALGEVGLVIHGPRLRKNQAPDVEEEEEFWFTDTPSLGPQKFEFIAGCPQETCLYGRMRGIIGPTSQSSFPFNATGNPMELSYDEMMEFFQARRFSIPRLLGYLDSGISKYSDQKGERRPPSTRKNPLHESLRALASAADIYRLLPSATVSVSVIVFQNLYEARWVPRIATSEQTMTRAETFACLAFFETGNLDLSPDTLGNVLAMASGDSMFISTALLCDPSEVPNKFEVTRVVGNIGRPGLAMLIAPEFPRSRDAVLGDWKFISHAPFRGDTFDSFKGTSMHLSFSGYSASLLPSDKHGVQDIDAYLLETVLSVYNGSEWIGDLNFLKTLESKNTFVRVDQVFDCGHDRKYEDNFRFVVFDSWEELLEGSEDTAVARAYKNWQARLALTCIAVQRGYKVFVLPRSVCWKCLYNGLGNVSSNNDGTLGPVLIM
jgi:hypothetical protein